MWPDLFCDQSRLLQNDRFYGYGNYFIDFNINIISDVFGLRTRFRELQSPTEYETIHVDKFSFCFINTKPVACKCLGQEAGGSLSTCNNNCNTVTANFGSPVNLGELFTFELILVHAS